LSPRDNDDSGEGKLQKKKDALKSGLEKGEKNKEPRVECGNQAKEQSRGTHQKKLRKQGQPHEKKGQGAGRCLSQGHLKAQGATGGGNTDQGKKKIEFQADKPGQPGVTFFETQGRKPGGRLDKVNGWSPQKSREKDQTIQRKKKKDCGRRRYDNKK